MILADREPKIAARMPTSISVRLVLKKMAEPLATALVDACNHAHFIEQAIVSVFERGPSAQEMKVIVADGGSTDNTSAIVRKFASTGREFEAILTKHGLRIRKGCHRRCFAGGTGISDGICA